MTGINDDITAVNDTDALNAGATINRSTSDTQELDHDDTDPDADDVRIIYNYSNPNRIK